MAGEPQERNPSLFGGKGPGGRPLGGVQLLLQLVRLLIWTLSPSRPKFIGPKSELLVHEN